MLQQNCYLVAFFKKLHAMIYYIYIIQSQLDLSFYKGLYHHPSPDLSNITTGNLTTPPKNALKLVALFFVWRTKPCFEVRKKVKNTDTKIDFFD